MTSNLRDRAAAGAVANRPAGAVDQQGAPENLGQLIGRMRGQMAAILPKHLDAERIARVALGALRKNPALAKSSPESFVGALLSCAELGLEPGGATGEAYLVPYEHRRGPLAGTVECQLIISYKGLAKLYFQSPLAQSLDAQAVHENDAFDYAYGLEPFLRHKPAFGNRGRIIAYYAVAKLNTGAGSFVVLSPEEVKELRRGKEGPSGNIADPQHWMERKVAIVQALKLLPKSTELQRALIADGAVRTSTEATALDDEVVSYVQAETVPQPQAIRSSPAPTPDNPVVDVPESGLVEELRQVADQARAGSPRAHELDPEGSQNWHSGEPVEDEEPVPPQEDLGGQPAESPRERALRVGREARERATGGNA